MNEKNKELKNLKNVPKNDIKNKGNEQAIKRKKENDKEEFLFNKLLNYIKFGEMNREVEEIDLEDWLYSEDMNIEDLEEYDENFIKMLEDSIKISKHKLK